MPQSAEELKAIRAKHDQVVWSKEVLAQKYESTFVAVVGQVDPSDRQFQVFKEFQFGQLILGTTPAPETLDWQITRTRFDGPLQESLAARVA